MKRILLTVIIANKPEQNTSETVKDEILELLSGNSQCLSYEKYEKIPGCYKAEFEVYADAEDDQTFSYNLLTLSSSIARPWMIYFQNNFATEMIYNKTEASSYNRPNLSTIIWAHIHHA
jgi:hypothetical protein